MTLSYLAGKSPSDVAAAGAVHREMERPELASEDIAAEEDSTSAAACVKVAVRTDFDHVDHVQRATRRTRASWTVACGMKSEDMDGPSERLP